MAGLYIHIPFCESRCIYCGFYSTTSLSLRDAYMDALCHEMDLRKNEVNEPLQTIYLGGGTPSQLTAFQLERLFTHIAETLPYASDAEITMECNPDDVTPSFCDTLRKLPINRISMGAQTFSDERLRFLHRRHTAEEVRTAVDRLRQVGISNISIDLMFGFPGETLEDWQRDIDEAIRLQVEHISAYSLMIEEGTPLYRMMHAKETRDLETTMSRLSEVSHPLQEIDEELSRMMYEVLIDRLTSAGYEHYEISNFAQKGYRSRHNSSYWHEVPYIGIGAAAHSYNIKTRSWNIDNIRSYIDVINKNCLPSTAEVLDLDTRFNDLMTTALRTSEGINIDHLQKEYGTSIYYDFMREAEKKIRLGLMQISEEGQIAITRKGIFISDDIMSDFIRV